MIILVLDRKQMKKKYLGLGFIKILYFFKLEIFTSLDLSLSIKKKERKNYNLINLNFI